LFDAPKELQRFCAYCFFQIFPPGNTNSMLTGYLPTQSKSNIKNLSTDFRDSFGPFTLRTILFEDIYMNIKIVVLSRIQFKFRI